MGTGRTDVVDNVMLAMQTATCSGILNWCEVNLPRFTQKQKHGAQKSNLTGLELTARRDVFRESQSLFVRTRFLKLYRGVRSSGSS